MNNKLGVELLYSIIMFVCKNIFSCLQMSPTKVVILRLNVLLISSHNLRNYKLVLNGVCLCSRWILKHSLNTQCTIYINLKITTFIWKYCWCIFIKSAIFCMEQNSELELKSRVNRLIIYAVPFLFSYENVYTRACFSHSLFLELCVFQFFIYFSSPIWKMNVKILTNRIIEHPAFVQHGSKGDVGLPGINQIRVFQSSKGKHMIFHIL